MAGGKILIIDPDATSLKYVGAALRSEGYEVLQSESAKEGLVVAWRDQPDLIVADPVTTDLAGEELATRLRSDVRTAKLPLVALSSDSQPARRTSCTAAGFSAFLEKSPEVMPRLMATLASLLGRPAPTAREGGLLITFLSAKGGTGTSSLCVNIGSNIAEDHPQSKVVVADLVLPIGSVAGIVGSGMGNDLVTLANLARNELTPDFLLRALPLNEDWGFQTLAGSPDPTKANEFKVARTGDIVSALQQAFDFVVLDLGRTLSRISLPLIQRADLVVMVLSGDPSTVMLSHTVWDYLHGSGLQAPVMYLILNRAVGLEGLTKADAEEIIGLPINSTIPHLAENFSLANNQHTPYAVKFPGDTASIILKNSAREIVDLARELRAR